MSLEKVVIQVGGQTDLDSTIKKLTELGVIDEKNAKAFKAHSKDTQGAIDGNTQKLGMFDKALTNIGPLMAGAFAIGSIVSFGKQVIDITAKFQKFEAVLTNTLGSKSEAQKAMKQIKEFAASTPFSVDELTSSYVKLANQGFKPTQEEMRKLGDLAAAMGKDFDMLTEAIIDAQTGEFERLKEFGIRASKEGDKVKFTFKGVQTQTDFTADSIRKYILSLGDLQGVSGGMAAISKTLGGQISNLGDSFDSLMVAIGDTFSDVVSSAIGALGGLVQGITEFIEIPLSSKLEDERIAFNGLVTQIISANDGSKRRKELIDELNTQYADYLPNLLTEKTTNEELAKVLESVNKQMVNKIIIEQQNEKIADTAKNVAEKRMALYKVEATMAKIVAMELKDYGLEEKARGKTMKEQIALIEEQTFFNGGFAGGLKDIKNKTESLLEAEEDLNAIQQEKLDIMKALGIEQEETVKTTEKQVEATKVLTEYEKLLAAERERIRKKQLEDRVKSDLRWMEMQKEGTQTFMQFEAITDQDRIKSKEGAEKKIREERIKSMKAGMKSIETEIKANQEADKKILEGIKRREAEIRTARQIGVDFAFTAADSIVDYFQERERRKTENQIREVNEGVDKELAALDRRRERGKLSEEAYQRQREAILKKAAQKEAEIKTKQAKDEKKFALITIALNTAIAVIKGISQFGPPPSPPGIAAIAAALATGAIQAAVVSATPIPKFKDGVIGVKGPGTETSDSILARLSKGESVMTARETRDYRSELEAMRKGTYEKYRLPVTRRQSLSEARHESMSENMYRSMMLKNEFNDKNIVSAITGSRETKKGKKELASMIATQISDRLSENNLYK